jgi:uncharacterized protein (DUF427 family)
MARAIWNGVILAQSDQTILVEGNHYFPPDSVNWDYFQRNEARTVCPWKGIASYYDIVVDGRINKGGAWYYPEPKSAAAAIKNRIAFWRGVQVES